MTDYHGFRIKELHAITAVGEDDEEGIAAIISANGALPMIASDRVRLDSLIKRAQDIADATGRDFKVVRFSVREDIGEIIGKKGTRQ